MNKRKINMQHQDEVLLLWGRLMSKKINDDKGKKVAKRDLMKTIFKMEEAGEDIDIKKPTYTK
ncbi:MAG: hypothetical protein ACLUD2_21665 [Clostridium sp.]